MKTLFETLKQRGFVAACTDTELPNRMAIETLTAYSGFDPTADSLHVGHLVPIMMLAHLQRAGHRVIALVGGTTAAIGDPSGRSEERNLLSEEVVSANAVAIEGQLRRFLDFSGSNAAICLDNRHWLGKDSLSLVEFLQEIGKHFSVTSMLAKDSVKNRLASESGISFTEFSYQLLQAFDFLHLLDGHGCTLQVGGSDQWGNITAGIELIRRKRRQQAFGLTCPLITTASGEKFGKSAGNAVWLDAKRTSCWDFFQFFVRQADADVVKLLKLFTFLPDEEISRLEQTVVVNPAGREAQRRLAFEITAMVHGQAVAQEMQRAAAVMFQGDIKTLSESTLAAVFANAPSSEIEAAQLEAGVALSALLARTALCPSITKGKKLIAEGGAYINNVRQASDVAVGKDFVIAGKHILLRAGKARHHLIRIA